MKEAKSYARTRGWLSLVEGSGWAILAAGAFAVCGLMLGIAGGALGAFERTLMAILIVIASLSGAAVMVALARIGHAVCDIAENTAAGNRRADRTPGRRDPVISRAPLSPRPGGDEADTD